MKNPTKEYKSICIFLIRHQGLSAKRANRIISEYGRFKEIEKKETGPDSMQQHLCEIAASIQSDWDGFMKFYRALPDKIKQRRQDRYNEQDDIREALQYTNGSADDF